MNTNEMGSKGGKAAAAKLTPEQRKARALKAALARWRAYQSSREYCSTCGAPIKRSK